MKLFPRVALLCVSLSLPLLSSDAIVLVHNSQDPALDLRGKTYWYFHEAFRPSKLVTNAAGAGIAQWRNDPKEWGQGAEGFAKRYGSRLAISASNDTFAAVVGAAIHADPRYVVLREGSAGHRAIFALEHGLISRYDDGKERPAYSRFAGAIGSAYLARTWYPTRLSDESHTLEYAAENIGSYMIRNLIHEFRPEINRVIHIKH
jgi:hypothetical protein